MTKRLRLLFPQWQGAGKEKGLYYGALEIRDRFMPDRSYEQVEVSEETEISVRHGIFGYDPILMQLKNAQQVISQDRPERIFTVGGDCGVEIAPVSYLNRLYNGDLANICVFTDSDFYIEDLLIEAIRTPHDAAMSVGYRITRGNRSVAVMTDLGHCPRKIIAHLRNTDIVLLESNHDIGMLNSSRYPRALKKRIAGDNGHLSNEAAGEAAVELIKCGVKGILLGHLSEENNYEDLAYNVVHQKLTAANIKVGKDMALGMAFRKKTAGVFHIK